MRAAVLKSNSASRPLRIGCSRQSLLQYKQMDPRWPWRVDNHPAARKMDMRSTGSARTLRDSEGAPCRRITGFAGHGFMVDWKAHCNRLAPFPQAGGPIRRGLEGRPNMVRLARLVACGNFPQD